MPVPPPPNPPVLFGSTPEEREASRTDSSLRLDWTPVGTATSYDVRFGASDERLNVTPGTVLGGLAPNQKHQVRVRGVNGDGNGPWSNPATLATRPSKPNPPSLQNPATDRRPDSLRLTWQEVNGVHDYELRVNGQTLPQTVQTPYLLQQFPDGSALRPNERYDVSIRARDDNAGGVSDWSDPGVFVTRPPTPTAPGRVPYDLFGWAIVLRWQVADTFHNGMSSFVRLWRTMGGGTTKELDGGSVAGGYRSHRFVDHKQRMSAIKRYRLQTVVPAAATPAPIPEDGGENRSFESDMLEAQYPIYMKALRSRSVPMAAGVDRVPITPHGDS